MFEKFAAVGESKLRNKLTPGWIVLFVTATCLMIQMAGFHATRLPWEQYERAQWVGHTRDVMEQLAQLALHITESETGQRGYLLTGNLDCLVAYEASVKRVGDDLETLQGQIADNNLQHYRLSRLRRQIQIKLNTLSETISMAHEQNEAVAHNIASTVKSQEQIQLIREKIDELWREEQTLLGYRMRTWRSAVARTQSVVIGSGLIIVVLLIVTGISLWRLASKERKLTETERQIGNIQRAKAERLMQIVSVQREISGHSLDLDVAMQAMSEHTRRLIQAEGSIVETLEGENMVYRAASGVASRHIGMTLKAEGSLSGTCVREGIVLKCDDSETDERVNRDACRSVGLRSMIVVPLRHKEQGLGVLKVLSSRVNAFDEDDVATLELLANVLSGVFRDAIAAKTLHKVNGDLLVANANLEKLATTDGMTGLNNHRTFQETLAQECLRASRSQQPLSLLLLDVDHFKKYNDSFGHPAGDTVLKRVAAIIQETCRVTDHAARYGGEEFAVLLPETDPQGANIIAERVRDAIASDNWSLRSVTVSIGVSTLQADRQSGPQLIAEADQALYQSKRDGRNRVTHSESQQQACSV